MCYCWLLLQTKLQADGAASAVTALQESPGFSSYTSLFCLVKRDTWWNSAFFPSLSKILGQMKKLAFYLEDKSWFTYNPWGKSLSSTRISSTNLISWFYSKFHCFDSLSLLRRCLGELGMLVDVNVMNHTP